MDNETTELASGWDDVEKASGQSRYLKLSSGDSVRVMLTNNPPKLVEKDWGDGNGPQQRYQLEFYNLDLDCLQTWETGKRNFSLVARQRNKRGANFLDAVWEISREGSTMADTRYFFEYDRDANEDEREARDQSGAQAETGSNLPF